MTEPTEQDTAMTEPTEQPTEQPNEIVQALNSIARDLHTLAELMVERHAHPEKYCRFDYQHMQPNGTHS